MTDTPSPTPEQIFKSMNPHLSDAECKKMFDDQAKLVADKMAEYDNAKTWNGMEPVAESAKADVVFDEKKVEVEPEKVTRASSAEGHDAGYKTRTSLPKDHK